MNKNEVTGTAQELMRKVEKQLGKVTGNGQAQVHGTAEELKGKAKGAAGHVESKAREIIQSVTAEIHRRKD
jgi:uncharacterized protein YjbJ (UPF0337 family)